jgi:hypothetical protein
MTSLRILTQHRYRDHALFRRLWIVNTCLKATNFLTIIQQEQGFLDESPNGEMRGHVFNHGNQSLPRYDAFHLDGKYVSLRAFLLA